MCFFNPGVEGLPVWDKPVGGRHVQTRSLKEEEKEATPEKNHQTLKKKTPEKNQILTRKTPEKKKQHQKRTTKH